MQYDPIPTLASLDVPLLALFGEKDENVVVSDNLPPMRAALERAGNRDFELFVVPGADHGLRLTPDPNLPPHRRVGFGSSGWPKVARWLRQRVDLGGSGR
jgi:pimeloyl-ACP methyl ester carboxylesterase